MDLRQCYALLTSEDALAPLLKSLRGELGLILYFHAIPGNDERDYWDSFGFGESVNGENQTIVLATIQGY